MSPDAWGPRFWPVCMANLRDRRAGQVARVAGRNGYLRKPDGRGRILWIKAGASPRSLRLGVELLGAIRQKRHDLRLVLTFEHDDEAILAPRVSGLRSVGLGFGPSDRPRTVARVLARLEPFGLILADTSPHSNLLREAVARGIHCIAFNTPPFPCDCEAAYPRNRVERQAWEESGSTQYLAPAADPASLWAEAQADVTLRALIGVEEGAHLWWWHGPRDRAAAFIAAWREDLRFGSDRLFVSVTAGHESACGDLPSISEWERNALPARAVMWVDDPRWLAAVASACTAGHLEATDPDVLWQALAGGRPLSAGSAPGAMEAPNALSRCEEPATVLDHWAGYAANPMGARRDGDAGRRRLWEERRGVEAVMSEFLQRVFDW